MTPVKSSFGGLPLAAFNRADGGRMTEGGGKGKSKKVRDQKSEDNWRRTTATIGRGTMDDRL